MPNPVDPAEDFADKWYSKEGLELQLEKSFWQWLQQAQSDFNILFSQSNSKFISEQAQQKFAVYVDKDELAKCAEIISPIPISPKRHDIIAPAKPWSAI